MHRQVLVILFFLGSLCSIHAQTDPHSRIITPHVSPALRFTENLGQWEEPVLFRAQLDGGALFLEKTGLTFSFYDKKKYRDLHHGGGLSGRYKNLDIRFHAYKIRFENCNSAVAVEKAQEGNDYENFYIGSDKRKWKSHVRNYHQIFMRDLYPGIDYEMITAVNGLKYNFHVQPDANPSVIKMKYEGVDNIRLKDGALFLKLEVNEVVEQKPYAYQLIDGNTKEVKCNYKFGNNVLSFEFPEGYNKNYELVIDPILVFAAQSGSTADNFGMSATYDSQGNLYAGGIIYSLGYPVTPGAHSSSFFGPVYYGNTDVVVTKYNSGGTNLIYSTYLGGSFTETVHSMIVDNNNNLCIYGVTSSTNFPTSVNAYDQSFNGGPFLMFVSNGMRFVNGTDIYVTKFNSNGTGLLASTFIGGSGTDGINHSDQFSNSYLVPAVPPATGNIVVFEPDYINLQHNYGDQCRGEIQVDASNNIYIASSTRSSDFPAVNGFDNNLSGTQDGILAKFDSNLSGLIYSSYIGGSGLDAGYGLIVQSNFEVYVTGGTTSNDLPYVTGGYQSTYQGGVADGYVVRVNSPGNVVLNGTYFGTSQYDQSFFIQSDKYSDIYVYGQSLGNIPVLAASNATAVYSVPNTHQFISRFNSSLSTLNMSTVFGNFTTDIDISPSAFAVDKCNNIYISGWGGNILTPGPPISNMPLLAPTQSSTDGFDFYFMGLDSNAVSLLYGSYFGGNISREHVDGGTSRFDPGGRIYQSVCAGCGGFDDFPVTPGSWPNTPGNSNHSSNCNNGVIKLDFQLQMAVATINTNTLAGCAPLTITFTNATPPPGSNSTYTWDLGNGNTTTTTINPVATYTAPGTYTIMLTVRDNLTCNKTDRSVTYITVLPKPNTNISITGGVCTNTISLNQISSGNLGSNPYQWDFGDGSPLSSQANPTHTYPNDGDYTVTLIVTDVNGCKDTKTGLVHIFNFVAGAVSSSSLCYGSGATLTATGGNQYTWTPASSLNNGFIASPVANPSVTTVYTVDIRHTNPSHNCGKTLTTQVQVLPTPTANYSYTINPCGGNIFYTDLSIDDVVRWQWILAPAKTTTVQHPTYFYSDGGTFTVSLISTNSYGCQNRTDKVLTVLDPPPLAVSETVAICRGTTAQLYASGGISYQWSPPQTLDFPALANPIASPVTSTEYSVVITTTDVVNGNVCSFLLTTQVDVDVLSTTPVSAKADPVLIVTGENSTLTYKGDPGAFVRWLPPGSTIPTNGYTVTASPDRPTTYTAVAQRGACVEDATVHVEAYTDGCIEKDVFIPNTFTPNDDGQNDFFRVKGLKIDEVYFAIYNRWGEKVFETNDLNKGWDGRYKNKFADPGVFGWYLKVKCINGGETFRKGNVTLIR